jgi:glycylpeptide N-tetradecanoyltransferase
MQKKDTKAVTEMLNEYLKKFKLTIKFNQEEVRHFFLPRERVIESFVVENPETKEITDFLSFYSLPSSILKHEEHKTLHVAYSYYNVPNTIDMETLIRNAIILAK